MSLALWVCQLGSAKRAEPEGLPKRVATAAALRSLSSVALTFATALSVYHIHRTRKEPGHAR